MSHGWILNSQDCMKWSLTHINFPEVSRRYSSTTIITFHSVVVKGWIRGPMVIVRNKCWIFIQLMIPNMPPFSNFEVTIFSPVGTISGEDWVVSRKFCKWSTGGGHGIRLTTEVLDYSFTRIVSERRHVERTSSLFSAVESQLRERQVRS